MMAKRPEPVLTVTGRADGPERIPMRSRAVICHDISDPSIEE